MNTVFAAGVLLSLAGTIGYLVGLGVSYPGRAFSLTVVMVGLTLFAIGSSDQS